ncbi:MAG: 4Fe-4S binding protein [Methanobacterium sp.]|uniref:4Fe-4S binding protein n=1 Tax=Methanobacterium sp. TaxID=2164 RepID=UPI003D6475F6|nr:4Fe-4S binding protein [Methanobacterium sp.]
MKIPTTKTDKKSYKPLREVEVGYEIDAAKCEQCKERSCLQACPVEAVHEIPPDKHIEIDHKCFGCILCREACPYDAIKMETTLSEPIRENIPNINPKLCRRCGACVDACRTGAIQLISSGREEAHSVIDEEKCVKCGYCARVCPTEAIKYGEILPRSVVGGKAVAVDQRDCIGCMTCTRVCPSKGAINVGNVSKLPFIDPSYCARCEECMDVCPSAAIKYSSRKKAYENFGKIKTMEIVSELLEKETKRLASDAGKIDSILNRISRNISYENTEEEFEIDVTDRLKAEIERAVDGDLEIEDIQYIIEGTAPKRNIAVIEDNCIGCTACMNTCPVNCIELEMPSPVHIGEECVYCGKCVEECQFEAISLKEEYFDSRNGRIFYIRKSLKESRTGEVAIDSKTCQLCGVCINKCPVDAMVLEDNKITVDKDKCIACNECELICPVKAVKLEIKQ